MVGYYDDAVYFVTPGRDEGNFNRQLMNNLRIVDKPSFITGPEKFEYAQRNFPYIGARVCWVMTDLNFLYNFINAKEI